MKRLMERTARSMRCFALVAAAIAALPTAEVDAQVMVVKARTIHIGNGKVVEDGAILVKDGKIAVVGPSIPIPRNAVIHDAGDAVVTPGFIDADAATGLRRANEESEEVIPSFDAIEGLDTRHSGFKARLRNGITAAWVGPGGRSVIGGTGAVIKTTGGAPEEVLVRERSGMRAVTSREAAAGNRATSGSATTMMYHRRPATRMGIVFMLREALYAHKNGTAAPRDTAAMKPVLAGETPLRVLARSAVDIRTALRVKREFGDVKLRVVLDDATEAHAVLDQIKANGAAVVLGPFYFYPRSGYEISEGYNHALDNAAVCHRAGIPMAFRTGGRAKPAEWRAEIGMLVRYGLPHAAAIRGLTLGAAEILGVQDRLGSIESGKDADLVVWDGDPLSPGTKALAVMVGGRVKFARAGKGGE